MLVVSLTILNTRRQLLEILDSLEGRHPTDRSFVTVGRR